MNIAAYPTYESYRDSGVDWIGEFRLDGTSTQASGLFDEERRQVV